MAKTLVGEMTVEEFKVIYELFNGSVNGIAKEYGVSRGAVYKKIEACKIKRKKQTCKAVEVKAGRARKGAKTKTAKERKQENRAAAVKEVVNNSENAQMMFSGQNQTTDRSFLTLNMLAMFLNRVQGNLDKVLAEMDENTGRIKPYQIDLMLKLVKEGRGLIGDTHKIRKDLFDIQGTMAFMEAVVRVLEEEMPDAQERLFTKLSQLGYEEQIIGADYTSGPTPKASKCSNDEAADSG